MGRSFAQRRVRSLVRPWTSSSFPSGISFAEYARHSRFWVTSGIFCFRPSSIRSSRHSGWIISSSGMPGRFRSCFWKSSRRRRWKRVRSRWNRFFPGSWASRRDSARWSCSFRDSFPYRSRSRSSARAEKCISISVPRNRSEISSRHIFMRSIRTWKSPRFRIMSPGFPALSRTASGIFGGPTSSSPSPICIRSARIPRSKRMSRER